MSSSIHHFSLSFFCWFFFFFCYVLFSERQGLTVTLAGLELTEFYASLPLSVGIKGNTTAPGSLVTFCVSARDTNSSPHTCNHFTN